MFLVTFLQIEWRTQDCPHKKYVICLVCFNKCSAPVILNITPALCCLSLLHKNIICIHGQIGDGLVLSVLPAAQAGGSRVPPVPGQGAARYARHCCNLSIKMSQICQISLLPLPTKDQPTPSRTLNLSL